MAYGQTGSGKTFTMGTGPYHGSISVDSDDIGIVPRVLRHIFENASQTTDPDIHTEIKVSFLEVTCPKIASFIDIMNPVIQVTFGFQIYNEDVYDILNPNRPRVQIRQQDTNVKVHCSIWRLTHEETCLIMKSLPIFFQLTDLTEFVVHSYDEGMKYLHDGASIRTTGATATSAHSSRSHAIFYVSLSRASRSRSIFKLSSINLYTSPYY